MKLFWSIFRFICRFIVLTFFVVVVVTIVEETLIPVSDLMLRIIVFTFIGIFLIYSIVHWRVSFGYSIFPEIGDRFYSKFYNSYGIVTRFEDEENWWYKLDGSDVELKAEIDPDKMKWIKKDL
ncbi:hypothetical protein BK125_20835 [Paenibacillus odorifer]|uniref:DUF5673 domain-containing protein n=1 Tax=Paenibacillus odorifer TaxID=189426 RepID=A0ABX3GIN8_9BACL|nr:hypothetical protein [Paenibacillus odorifer]OMC74249.1 hypothetical protein BK125_20835 [Paenibacillus odorifer]OMD14807.1 hypothetical protein BSO21_27670 [Paenibacillus odorifer]